MDFSKPPSRLRPLQQELLVGFFQKVCALVGRCEIKDLVDLREILATGLNFEQAVADGEQKDAGLDPATLAWVLSELTVAPSARLPSGIETGELVRFRDDLVRRLRQMAFDRTRAH